MQTLTLGSKTVFVFSDAEPEAPVIYLNTFSDEGKKVYEAAQAAGCPPFTLVTISDIAPWASPPTERLVSDGGSRHDFG